MGIFLGQGYKKGETTRRCRREPDRGRHAGMLRLNTRGGTELSANRLGCERLLLSLLSCLLGHGVLEAELSFKPGAQEILLPLGQGEFQLAHVNGDARVDILVALPGRINAYLNDGSGV